MNIEMEEVAVHEISDDFLEISSGSAQFAPGFTAARSGFCSWC